MGAWGTPIGGKTLRWDDQFPAERGSLRLTGWSREDTSLGEVVRWVEVASQNLEHTESVFERVELTRAELETLREWADECIQSIDEECDDDSEVATGARA